MHRRSGGMTNDAGRGAHLRGNSGKRRSDMSSESSLSSVAEKYFYSINPLARRIGEDIVATKDAYEGLWSTLSNAERSQAIDETIIQPEVAFKYTLKRRDQPKDTPQVYPKLILQTGMKYVIDETGSTLRWRDEHSAPFSFMTQSQMNLSYVDSEEKTRSFHESPRFTSPSVKKSTKIDEYDQTHVPTYRNDRYSGFESDDTDSRDGGKTDSFFLAKLIDKTSLLKIQSNRLEDDTESLVPRKSTASKKENDMRDLALVGRTDSSDINESTALLDTPSSYSSFHTDQLNLDDGIPKTGFEFLDNW